MWTKLGPQVAGFKYVRLYYADQSDFLYCNYDQSKNNADSTTAQNNISPGQEERLTCDWQIKSHSDFYITPGKNAQR